MCESAMEMNVAHQDVGTVEAAIRESDRAFLLGDGSRRGAPHPCRSTCRLRSLPCRRGALLGFGGEPAVGRAVCFRPFGVVSTSPRAGGRPKPPRENMPAIRRLRQVPAATSSLHFRLATLDWRPGLMHQEVALVCREFITLQSNCEERPQRRARKRRAWA